MGQQPLGRVDGLRVGVDIRKENDIVVKDMDGDAVLPDQLGAMPVRGADQGDCLPVQALPLPDLDLQQFFLNVLADTLLSPARGRFSCFQLLLTRRGGKQLQGLVAFAFVDQGPGIPQQIGVRRRGALFFLRRVPEPRQLLLLLSLFFQQQRDVHTWDIVAALLAQVGKAGTVAVRFPRQQLGPHFSPLLVPAVEVETEVRIGVRLVGRALDADHVGDRADLRAESVVQRDLLPRRLPLRSVRVPAEIGADAAPPEHAGQAQLMRLAQIVIAVVPQRQRREVWVKALPDLIPGSGQSVQLLVFLLMAVVDQRRVQVKDVQFAFFPAADVYPGREQAAVFRVDAQLPRKGTVGRVGVQASFEQLCVVSVIGLAIFQLCAGGLLIEIPVFPVKAFVRRKMRADRRFPAHIVVAGHEKHVLIGLDAQLRDQSFQKFGGFPIPRLIVVVEIPGDHQQHPLAAELARLREDAVAQRVPMPAGHNVQVRKMKNRRHGQPPARVFCVAMASRLLICIISYSAEKTSYF